jgi:GT2 family glycosyltransferase
VSPARDLSVIIVSHGHEALLPACLASLGPALEGLSAEILLVDNLPRDGLGPALASTTVPVRVFENSRPQGLSANVNLAAAQSSATHLLILNPDTEHRAGTVPTAPRSRASAGFPTPPSCLPGRSAPTIGRGNRASTAAA